MTDNSRAATKSLPSIEARRFDKVTQAACARLQRNRPVRRTLPGGGRLRIDRQLPFLCVYRKPPGQEDVGTRDLVTTEAAYLFASGDKVYHEHLANLCREVTRAMQEHFGTFLFLEIWALPEADGHLDSRTPAFEIFSPDLESLPSTITTFHEALEEITIRGARGIVTRRSSDNIVPPGGMEPLADTCPENAAPGCCSLGLGVRPIYRDAMNGLVYPMLLQNLRWQLAVAIRKGIAQFSGIANEGKDAYDYHSLGPSSMVKAVRTIDQQLCDVADAFDFLLQVTPVNSEAAWEEFRDSGFERAPAFHYRPLPYRPSLLKRKLFEIEIERVEDPTLAHLFSEKRDELDRQLSALQDLETTSFLYSSLQLFGNADPQLLDLATTILGHVSARDAPAEDDGPVGSTEFVEQATSEIDHYRHKWNEFDATIQVRDDIASGVMVSRDTLLVAESLHLRPHRVEALLHHEIGTHLLTYFNGRCQPLQQLSAGLARHDELQEGLAVFGEFLCGGLTAKRLQNLAGRVLAVHAMVSGQSFVETFRLLHRTHRFGARQAFITTLRVYRGGGLTKDVIYLRGLRDLLHHLNRGHDIEPLYVGKIGLHHLPYIQELRRRGIVGAPKVLPRYLTTETARQRLDDCRSQSLLQLLEIEQ